MRERLRSMRLLYLIRSDMVLNLGCNLQHLGLVHQMLNKLLEHGANVIVFAKCCEHIQSAYDIFSRTRSLDGIVRACERWEEQDLKVLFVEHAMSSEVV